MALDGGHLPLAPAGPTAGGIPGRLAVASLSTLGLLFGFLLATALAGLYLGGIINWPATLVITVLANLLTWAIGPWLSDLTYRWFYGVKFYQPSELAAVKPELAAFLQELCRRQNLAVPKVGIIADGNPTAFTYGSNTRNARIIVTEGLWQFLGQDELDAVVAHEVGHIVHRDFIVMAIANTVLQLLYEIYYVTVKSTRRSSSRDGNKAALLGLIAFVFYQIGYYAVLFLSRLRESYADEFAAEVTGDPNSLSTALVKIGYGIISRVEADGASEDSSAKPDDGSSSDRLLESTKTLGIMGPGPARQAGIMAKTANMDGEGIGRSCLFDLVSPWAKISELTSTHPLTGKRLANLERLCLAMGKTPVYPISRIRQTSPVDKQRLWAGFWGGVTVNFMPAALVIMCFVCLFGIAVAGPAAGYAAAGFLTLSGIALFGRVFYRYPKIISAPTTTVLERMQDVYASPVKGTPVQMSGTVIGRGNPGFFLGEDVVLRDRTGLMYLNYTSFWGFIGNAIFGWRHTKRLIGQEAAAEGWFFRSFSNQVVLSRLQPQTGALIKSYARYWSLLGAWLVLLAGLAGILAAVTYTLGR